MGAGRGSCMERPVRGIRVRAATWLEALGRISERRWLLLLALVVVIPRLLWIAAMPAIPFTDFAAYDGFAQRLAAGRGYATPAGIPTAYWPVGYPLFLAAIYKLVGHHYLPIKLIQTGLALMTAICAYLLARPLSERVGRLAGLLVALWPSMIGGVDLLAGENLFVPLFTASVLMFGSMIGAGGSARPRPWLAGAALGAATLVRPLGMGIGALAFALAMIHRRRRQPGGSIAAVGLACAVAVLVVLPWSLRNLVVMHSLIPVSANSGVNLWIGNHEGATGAYVEPRALQRLTAGMSEPRADKEAARRALLFVKEHPAPALAIIPRKLWHLFARDTGTVGWMHFDSLAAPRPRWLKWVFAGAAQAYYAAALLLAAFGLLRGGLKTPTGRWLGLVCLYYVAVHLIFFGGDRFHLPILPMIAVFSALGLTAWVDRPDHQ